MFISLFSLQVNLVIFWGKRLTREGCMVMELLNMNKERTIFPMLKRELTLIDVFCIASGAMISSGLFVLPGLAFGITGPSLVLSYALAALFMIPTMMSQAELSTAMPKSGGSYFFVERSLGPLMGTMAGLANWFSIALKATFALVGIGAFSTLFLPDAGVSTVKIVSLAFCLIFTILNIISVKHTGRLQNLLVYGLFAILIFYIGAGFKFVNLTRFHPFMPKGMSATLAVAGLVFISYGGLTKVVDIGEKVREPHRSLPLGMILAFVSVNILYVLATYVTVGTVAPEKLSGSIVPLALGAQVSMGIVGRVLISIGAFLAFATTANAGILSASRSPMAMSRDGLLPEILSRTSGKTATPYVSILITSLSMGLVIVFLSIEDLVKTASTMMLLMFILINASVIIMRQSHFQSDRPTFRVPLYPLPQIAAIIIYVFLIIDMGMVPLLISFSFCFAACFWYILYVSRRIERESALVFLVNNVISRKIRRIGMEQELRQISLERDDMTMDRFDLLAKDCIILDIPERIPAKDMFRRVARELSESVHMPEARLYEMFLERERETSTIVHPGLAIPHIIVEGQGIFKLLLVRAVNGIIFSDLHPPVKTVFVLVGSRDERNYHLRALMTIAHIVEETDFEKRWSEAGDIEQLRDVILLSRRKRMPE